MSFRSVFLICCICSVVIIGCQYSGLARELQSKKALITTWPSAEIHQFNAFVERWQNENPPQSFLQLWRHLNSTTTHNPPPSSASPPSFGYLAYETISNMGVAIRANAKLGLSDDIWCTVYPSEVTSDHEGQSFADFLVALFPQLVVLSESIPRERIAVKYSAHRDWKLEEKKCIPVTKGSLGYQTIGTLSSAAANVLAR